MYDLDVEQFWKDDALAHEDNCFFSQAPQVALGIRMSDECVFSELHEPGTPWMPIPIKVRIELNKRYNDKAQKIVGLRLLQEEYLPEDTSFPAIKRIGEVFGGSYIYENDTEWLTQGVSSTVELERLLDRVEKLDLRSFLLPENWELEKRRIYETHGIKPDPVRGVRGPVTLACSIMGVENLIFLILDAPELAQRFSQAITRVIIGMGDIMDEEAGVTPATHLGYGFADDNCCLLSPEMYALFGYPVLKAVFQHFSPNPGDQRYQHSDSAMGHLLPLLGQLNLTGVNFGPTVLVDQIRRHMPHTCIDGCLAPFTFMRNDAAQIISEVRRDCLAAKTTKGLNLTTAGSINDGSSLDSMRLIMSVIQHEGRY